MLYFVPKNVLVVKYNCIADGRHNEFEYANSSSAPVDFVFTQRVILSNDESQRDPSFESSAAHRVPASLTPEPTFRDRHYTVAEIAGMWKLSEDAVRRLFKNEPGVTVIPGRHPRVRKRAYTTLRIPESVLARVYSRITLS